MTAELHTASTTHGLHWLSCSRHRLHPKHHRLHRNCFHHQQPLPTLRHPQTYASAASTRRCPAHRPLSSHGGAPLLPPPSWRLCRVGLTALLHQPKEAQHHPHLYAVFSHLLSLGLAGCGAWRASPALGEMSGVGWGTTQHWSLEAGLTVSSELPETDHQGALEEKMSGGKRGAKSRKRGQGRRKGGGKRKEGGRPPW